MMSVTPASFFCIRDFLRYSPETGEFTRVRATANVRGGTRAGRLLNNCYRVLSFKGVEYPEHCVAWFFLTGEYPASLIDHINRNRSDNRSANLRLATGTQNNANSISTKGKSPFKGVSWYAAGGCWQASIKCRGRSRHLGYFTVQADAAAAYDAAAIDLFGEFARPNFDIGSQPRRQAIADLPELIHSKSPSLYGPEPRARRRPKSWKPQPTRAAT